MMDMQKRFEVLKRFGVEVQPLKDLAPNKWVFHAKYWEIYPIEGYKVGRFTIVRARVEEYQYKRRKWLGRAMRVLIEPTYESFITAEIEPILLAYGLMDKWGYRHGTAVNDGFRMEVVDEGIGRTRIRLGFRRGERIIWSDYVTLWDYRRPSFTLEWLERFRQEFEAMVAVEFIDT